MCLPPASEFVVQGVVPEAEAGGLGEGGHTVVEGDGLGWWTRCTIHSWCIIEVNLRNLDGCINQCHPSKFKDKKREEIVHFSIAINCSTGSRRDLFKSF